LPIPIAPPKQNNTQTTSCKNSMVNVTILSFANYSTYSTWGCSSTDLRGIIMIIPTKNHHSPAAPSSADNWATSKLFIISWRR
jgi:hypothetical protein